MTEPTESRSYHDRIADQGPKTDVPASGGAGSLPYAEEQTGRPRRWTALVIVVLLGLAIAAGSVVSGDSSSSAAPEVPPVQDAAPPSTPGPDGSASPETGRSAPTSPSTVAPSTTAPVTTTTTPTTTTLPAATADIAREDLPRHEAVYRDGKLVLQGTVPSTAVRDRFREEAAAVIGADNVIVRYQIDPRVPEPTDGRVRVDEDFLFAVGSARIDGRYRPLMDLGVTVMELNPQARMRIVGHTDDVGSEEANRSLAQARAGALRDYLSIQGIDPDRVEAVGVGESAPVVANDSAAKRAQNRRIEVELLDLLAD